MTPAEVQRADRRSRLSVLHRIMRAERSLKDQDEPECPNPETRIEDVEQRLTAVEGRVDQLVADYVPTDPQP